MKNPRFLSKQALKKLKAAELSQYMAWLNDQKEKNEQKASAAQKKILALGDDSARQTESRKRRSENEQIQLIRQALNNQ